MSGTFGRYRIDALLGEGGMGKVFRAFDTRLHRPVALKILQNVQAAGNDARRLVAEARAAAAIDHPNVVTVYDVGEERGIPFVAMQLLEGQSLRAYVGRPSPDVETRLGWLAQVAQALAAAHRLGIVHRDIKPENVLVCSGGIKVLDFGIAKRLADSGAPSTGPVVSIPGVLLGTPSYMAPEQRTGHTTDARSDQYQWGLVAFELLTGQLPAQPGLPVRSALAGVPEHAAAAIDRALAPAPDARFPSMEALLGALDPRTAQSLGNASTVAANVIRPADVSPYAPTVARGSAAPPIPSAPPLAGAPHLPSAPPLAGAPHLPSAPPAQPLVATLPSRGAGGRSGLVVAAILGGLAVAGVAGAVGWLAYARVGPAAPDAAPAPVRSAEVQPPPTATTPSASPTSPKTPPTTHRDAGALASDAGHASDAAVAQQHVHTVLGNSPFYSFEQMDHVLTSQRKGLDRCLATDRAPPQDGPYQFNLTIRADGSVSQARARIDRPVVRCMGDQLQTAVFPPLKGGAQIGSAGVSISIGD